MSEGRNPYLPEYDNPMDGYNASIKRNFGAGHKESLSLQKSAYDALHGPAGTEFLSLLEKELCQTIARFSLQMQSTELHLACYKGKLELIEQIRNLIAAQINFISNEK
jgi:hypothetical protein